MYKKLIYIETWMRKAIQIKFKSGRSLCHLQGPTNKTLTVKWANIQLVPERQIISMTTKYKNEKLSPKLEHLRLRE